MASRGRGPLLPEVLGPGNCLHTLKTGQDDRPQLKIVVWCPDMEDGKIIFPQYLQTAVRARGAMKKAPGGGGLRG